MLVQIYTEYGNKPFNEERPSNENLLPSNEAHTKKQPTCELSIASLVRAQGPLAARNEL